MIKKIEKLTLCKNLPNYSIWGTFSTNLITNVRSLDTRKLNQLQRVVTQKKKKKMVSYFGFFRIKQQRKEYTLQLACYKKKEGYSIHIAITNDVKKRKKMLNVVIFEHFYSYLMKLVKKPHKIHYYHESTFPTNKVKLIFTLPQLIEKLGANKKLTVQGIRTVIKDNKKTELTSVLDVSDDGKKVRMIMGFTTKIAFNTRFFQSWYSTIEDSMKIFFFQRTGVSNVKG